MKEVLLSILGVCGVLATLFVAGCGITEPKGTEGKITLSDSLFAGTIGSVTVTLNDADLTQTVVSVKVTSSADPGGLILRLTGKNGVYIGKLAFSTTASANHAILVTDSCRVTVTYADAMPAGYRTATLIWTEGTVGKVTLSDSLFAGIKGLVTVTLIDTDLTDTVVSVGVTSWADQVGLILRLTGKNGVYTGQLAFSTTASAGNAILVTSNSLVTITYNDAMPAGTRTATLIWKAGTFTITISLDKNSYQGVSNPMVIVVTDTNVSSAIVTAMITTTTYTTPVLVTLMQIPGTIGLYTDTVYFTAGNTATIKDTIRVKDGDTVTVVYYNMGDPAYVVWREAVWTASTSMVQPGASVYLGFVNKRTVNVSDPNYIGCREN
jgi:hypothetical protein